MPQNLPERPDFFARHRALPEQAGATAFHERLGAPFELPGHPASGPRRAGRCGGGDPGPAERREFRDRARRTAHHRPGLPENLTGGFFVNRSAAFSAFHGSAANPAAGATLSDPAFGTGRFATLQPRRPATAEQHTEESADA